MLSTDQMVKNIIATYNSANEAERVAGMEWYEIANTLCHGWAEKYGVSIETAAAVLAVISPRLSWTLNVAYAERIFATGTAPIMHGTLAKVRRLLEGEAPDSVLGGKKVRSFFSNILFGVDFEVTVDRHAFDIAMGTIGDDTSRKVLERKGMYELVAVAYRAAAADLGLLPKQVQAVTWVAHRNQKGA